MQRCEVAREMTGSATAFAHSRADLPMVYKNRAGDSPEASAHRGEDSAGHREAVGALAQLGVRYVYDDGGRAAAGFRGVTGDCVTRAIAIAAQLPYREVYDDLNAIGSKERRSKRRRRRSSARTGVHIPTTRRYLASIGWRWVPTMAVGRGCTTHLRPEELPGGRLIVSVSRHMVAVIDGVIHDTHDPSRDGMRCVYGYFHKPTTSVDFASKSAWVRRSDAGNCGVA